MSITLEPEQQNAVDAVYTWYTEGRKPRFTLAGLAGTGKSTIVNFVIEALGKPMVAYATFTGKAALVLRRKGIPCRTIHKLIYTPREDEKKNLIFELNDELDAPYDLIVVDEASMVDAEIREHLESFNIPVLYIGDHGQLPPIKGQAENLLTRPDIKLEKIHRQAEGNPIIKLATLARKGIKIPFAKYGEGIWKVHSHQIRDSHLLEADQVLCGKNKTRIQLNKRMRAALNFIDPPDAFYSIPQTGDKIICLKNNWNRGLVNGLVGITTGVKPFRPFKQEEEQFKDFDALEFMDEDGNPFSNILFEPTSFLVEKPEMNKKDFEYFDYGYAITVHKAQGSQYINPVIYEEWLGKPDFHAKWLYTAITRAAEKLILVAK